ncbi:MAG: transporter substrate-binding domain-containing protein [Clostridia bacterium]|nr:transporter substrate-binding domain-containing protein [Clostridia bacterium]
MKKIIAFALTLVLIVGSLGALTSCGSEYETKFGKEFVPTTSQMDVLLQLNAKSIDVGVMDSIMAGYYMSKDTTYANSLMIVPDLVLATEQYGIAARKGSALAKAINISLVELAKAGTVNEIAKKYGVESEICIDTTYELAEDPSAAELEDFNYIMGKGKLIVGYTLFAPIAYKDDNGNLIGFDIDLAKAVCEMLELEVEFVEIEWSAKEALLEAKTIDCIWNGMTITEERLAAMEISIPYMNNKQVAVIRKDDKDLYKTTDDMKKAIIGAEDGSAGMDCVVVENEEE